MRRWTVVALLLVLAPLAPAPGVIVPEPAWVRPRPASGLEGKHFRSVLDHEIGLTPTGVAYGPWHLAFTADGFTWDYSDLRTGGGYRYDPVTGEIHTLWFREDVAARCDLRTGLLEWDGKLYREVDGHE